MSASPQIPQRAQPLPHHLVIVDLVFLRNVRLYFDVPTKKQILARLAAVMRPGALLFLGSVESTLNLCDRFTELRLGKATCYERTGQWPIPAPTLPTVDRPPIEAYSENSH